MLKRLLTPALVLGALVVLTSSASAWCRQRCGGGCGACGQSTSCCSVPCAPTVVAAPAPAPTYTERKVTVYKPIWTEQDVACTVRKPVMLTKDETYCWTEMVRTVTPTKQLQHYCEQVMVDQPYSYTVMDRVVTPTKKSVTTYSVSRQTVTEMVPCCRRVRVCCCDPCTGCCYHTWTTVTEMKPRCKTVCVRTPCTKEVCVDVVSCVPRTVSGTRKVCKLVDKTREVTVNVESCKPVTKTGTRKVSYCEYKSEVVHQKVKACKMVPTVETIKVATCAPTATCQSGCGGCGSTGCGHRRHFALFHRNHGCGC